MSTVLEQIPLRLQATIGTLAPIDSNTGETPQIFRGQSLSIPFAIFQPNDACVDLTNIAQVTLSILAAEDSEIPLAGETLLFADLIPVIARQAWLDGSAQQGTFIFSSAETDQSLGGLNSAALWIQLTAITKTGTPLIYAAGPAEFINPGAVIPPAPFGYVSRNQQTNETGNSTVSPTSLNHTEIVDITGAARDSNLILSTIGMKDGAVLRLRVFMTATPDINLTVRNGTSGGAVVATFSTGSVLNGLLTLDYDEDGGIWELLEVAFPSTF